VNIELIAIDIDGTLLDSQGNLPNENRLAVGSALDAGIKVVLATGRAFHHAKPIADMLSDRVVLIVSNGAITKRTNGSTLASQLLSREIAMAIITETRKSREGAALIFDRSDKTQYVFEGIDWTHPNRQWYYERNSRFMTEVPLLETTLNEDPAQVAFNGSVKEMRELAVTIRRLQVAEALSVTLTEYEDRDFSLLDIIASNWSKGKALEEWAHELNLRRELVMAVGDNLNDREMLEFAGRPVVMGNAVASLKSTGWPITATNDDAGVASAIRAIALENIRLKN